MLSGVTGNNKLREKWQSYLIICLFSVLFMAGLLVTPNYGQHYDENYQFTLLYANCKEYVIQLFDGEMQEELLQWFDEKGVVEISASDNKDHGIAAYYPAAFLLLTEQISHRVMLVLWNGYTYLLFFLGVIALYYIGKRIFQSRSAGCFLALFFYLTPRMFAEGHYNNKDVILLCLSLVSVWMGAEFVYRRKLRYAVLMAVAAAFAANIKIVGAWPFGLIGLWYLWDLTSTKEWNAKNFLLGCSAVISFIAAFAVITPACWDDPVSFLQYLAGNAAHFQRWNNEVLFAGSLYRHGRNPLPRTYLLRMILITLPPYILAFWGIGQGALIYRLLRLRKAFFQQRENCFMALAGIWWFLPLCFAMLGQILVYNIWRHFYFCYGGILILAMYGVYGSGSIIKSCLCRLRGSAVNRLRPVGLMYAIAALCMLWTGWGMLKNHPYEYVYYNIFAGGEVEKMYELDYWNVGSEAILEKLYHSSDRDPDKILSAGACDNETRTGIGDGIINLYHSWQQEFQYTQDWEEANYIFINTTYARREELLDNPDLSYVVNNYRKLDSITAYGNELWSVYEKTE